MKGNEIQVTTQFLLAVGTQPYGISSPVEEPSVRGLFGKCIGSGSSIFLFSSPADSLPSAEVLLCGSWASREPGRVDCMTLGDTGGELEGGEGVSPDIVEGGARGPFFLDEVLGSWL